MTLDDAVDHVRGAAVALVGTAMLVLGFPGLDGTSARWLEDPEDRARALRTPTGALEVVASDFNRVVRRPLERAFAPLQRPLRIAQSWSLYGSGPNRSRRAELWVDGELRYRSQDPDHAWLAPLLRFRKVRPVLVATCHEDGPNGANLVRFLAARARRDFPGARELVLRCTAARWPGDGEVKETLRWTASAPDWEPR